MASGGIACHILQQLQSMNIVDFDSKGQRSNVKCPANEIISKIEEAAAPLRFDVKKNNYKLKLQGKNTGRKGHLYVATKMRFNLRKSFPLLTTKKVFWLGVVEELLRFISGLTSAKEQDFTATNDAKATKPEENISCDSPWGKGRPGWHTKCSAMSATYLTEKFDIHSGGMDLMFRHHENEIAQSCAANPNSNVSYWMHNCFATVNSEKMPKSRDILFTIRQVTDIYHPLALTRFLLGTHYRSPVNYSIDPIEISQMLSITYIRLHTMSVQTLEETIRRLQEGHVHMRSRFERDVSAVTTRSETSSVKNK